MCQNEVLDSHSALLKNKNKNKEEEEEKKKKKNHFSWHM